MAISAGGGFLALGDGQVTGSTGCRAFRGPAVVSGTRVTFGTPTLVGPPCAGDQAPTEAAVLAVLHGTVDAAISAKSLRLTAADGIGLTLRAE